MSSKLSRDDVKKIARLARLDSNPDGAFLDKYKDELSSVLDYVDQLQEVNVGGISPTDGIRTISVCELRDDDTDINEQEYSRVRKNIISNFPSSQGDLLILPGIFNEN